MIFQIVSDLKYIYTKTFTYSVSFLINTMASTTTTHRPSKIQIDKYLYVALEIDRKDYQIKVVYRTDFGERKQVGISQLHIDGITTNDKFLTWMKSHGLNETYEFVAKSHIIKEWATKTKRRVWLRLRIWKCNDVDEQTGINKDFEVIELLYNYNYTGYSVPGFIRVINGKVQVLDDVKQDKEDEGKDKGKDKGKDEAEQNKPLPNRPNKKSVKYKSIYANMRISLYIYMNMLYYLHR